MSDPLHQAKRPVTALAGPYGHPLHPILVTVPIGAWTASLLFDLASHVVDGPAFLARASLWLVAIGVIGALAAAMFGFLDFLAIRPGTAAYRTALVHLGLNLAITAAYGASWAWRAAGTPDGPVPIGQIILSVIAMAALGASGFLGGKLAYRYGVRVAGESTQAEGFTLQRKG
ncbi:DUF2231 domain-containing protein [Actinomadura macrotermitis]|uniref:DUF2231 domain-containing protein n=1 Tax=Actinomadura macrotermitis TaxID=2585200 RepID=A0A7K0BSX7_9ACTN|nr:DUF2231 domain-containing protein [Actinomadura macrotermitis]MQY03784.1 hypothetical protein [Actinomadura macrotermitis]